MRTPVRIFVSSSLCRAAEEPQLLIRDVIPSLDQVCEEHNVDLQPIDLRWGIRDDADPSFDVEKLRSLVGPEIGRASLFVSLLGRRFGRVPIGEYDSASALEIYRAIATPSLSLMVFKRDPTVAFEDDDHADDGDEPEQEKLLRRLEWLGVPLYKYRSQDEFSTTARAHIANLLHEQYFSKHGALFLSYSRKDVNLAQRVAESLRAMRFNVWQDTSSIDAGDDWASRLATGIEESDVFLFLASKNSASSRYCSKEITHALNSSKPMLTVHIDEEDLPRNIEFLVGDTQRLQLSSHDGFETALSGIAEAARRLIIAGRRLTPVCS